LLVTLRHCREMREFCGFQKVPDAAKLTRFKQDFLPYLWRSLNGWQICGANLPEDGRRACRQTDL